MLVSVMHIRIVCVGMLNRFVHVDVGMGRLSIPVDVMMMLVMCIVDMGVLMFQGKMAVKMDVVFHDVQPYPEPHEYSCDK